MKSGLNVAQPAIDERGRVTAVVWASLDLGWVADFVKSSGLPDGTILTLGELQALASPPDPEGRLGLVAARLEAYAFEEATSVVDEMIAGLPQASRP